MKAALQAAKEMEKISINVGRNVGSDINKLASKDIEKAVAKHFPGSKIVTHDVIPPKPESHFGPFEHTSRVTIEAPSGDIKASTHALSEALAQDAIPALNHTTGEAVLAGPKAEDWGGAFNKSYFVHPGDEAAFGNAHVEDVPFVHYSRQAGLGELDPAMYGTGMKGAEAGRLADAPDVKHRSYFYVDKGADTMKPESGVGGNKYTGTATGIYNLANDPRGLRAETKAISNDPYLAKQGINQYSQDLHLNNLERAIKGAGYKGYHTGDTGVLFEKTPVQEFAKGGEVLKAAAKLFEHRPTTIVKASEALGAHEGKKLGLTQTDNFGVHGGRMGGNQFPNFQNISPAHQESGAVWMNDAEKHANDMVKKSGDDTIWSTYIGGPDQLKSNKTVFNDILNQHYQRNLTPEQIDLINARIGTMRKGKEGPLVFPNQFDIRDPYAAAEMAGDTFDRRSALASILGEGKGVGGTKSGIALPQYQDILRSHRDPLTEGIPTSSIGTRLFTVDPKRPAEFRQDLHPDYNWAVYGQDQGVQFAPVPHSLATPDFYNRQFAKTGLAPHGNSWFGYMKEPQLIDEKLLTNMQKAGYKKGGKVKKKKK